MSLDNRTLLDGSNEDKPASDKMSDGAVLPAPSCNGRHEEPGGSTVSSTKGRSKKRQVEQMKAAVERMREKGWLPRPGRRPEPLTVQPGKIPERFKDKRQWVGWDYESRDGQYTKPLIDIRTGKYASTDESDTWASFEEVVEAYQKGGPCLAGIGRVFTEEDGIVGFDIDDCVNPAAGEIAPWALGLLKVFDTYAEYTPSGTGVRAYLEGRLPGKGRKRPRAGGGVVEIYDRGRYFTFTGRPVPGFDRAIRSDQAIVEQLYRWAGDRERKTPKGGSGQGFDFGETWCTGIVDAEVIAIARQAKNSEKFRKLFDEGDWESYDCYRSQSEADLALCRLIAFYTGPDPEQSQ